MNALIDLPLWKGLLLGGILLGILLAAAATDLRERKVYNKLTYPAFLLGLVFRVTLVGWESALDSFLTALVIFVGGLLILPLRLIGAGDIKLLMVLAAFLGPSGLAPAVFYAVFAGAVLGLLQAARNRYLLEMFRRLGRFFRGLFRMLLYRTPMLREPLERDERSLIPFAVAILIGTCLALSEALWGFPTLYDNFTKDLR